MNVGDRVRIRDGIGWFGGKTGVVHRVCRAFIRVEGVPGAKGLLHISPRDLEVIDPESQIEPPQFQSMDIDSGLGIGGIGSDDYNIGTEQVREPGYIHGIVPHGTQVCPAGTTYGTSDPDGRCAICGKPADWNPGAGKNLCSRHWDEY